MGHYKCVATILNRPKGIADAREAVDLFVNRLGSTGSPEVIDDALVVSENHGGPHVGAELLVDGRSAPLVVVLSQGELNGTKQVIGEHRDEEVRCGPPCQLMIDRATSEIAHERSEGVFDFGQSHIDVI